MSIIGELPNLASIVADLSNGDVVASQSLPGKDQLSQVVAGPTSASIAIWGNPIRIAQIPFQLSLAAKDVKFNYGRTPTGQIIAIPNQATDGQLNIKLAQNDLDTALLLLARKFSAKQGVEVLKVETTLSSTSPTALNLQIKVSAKKFMTAVIQIAGQVLIDDRMRLTASNLKATSTGMVGNVAVGLLQPQLNKLDGRPLPLLKYTLGNLKLHGVAIDTIGGLALSASFGGEPS